MRKLVFWFAWFIVSLVYYIFLGVSASIKWLTPRMFAWLEWCDRWAYPDTPPLESVPLDLSVPRIWE